jgi:hypothetical protein
MLNKSKAGDAVSASVTQNVNPDARVQAGGVFKVTCYDKDGNLKWEDEFHNLVVNVGLKDMNEKYFTGASYNAAWYIGLVNNTPTPSYSLNDTMASHGGWSEFAGYSVSGNATIRATCTFGSSTTADPSVISNSASVAVFSITSGATVAGAFLTSSDVKSGTTGILFSEANFSSARTVAASDTLNVTYTFSLDAA